MPCNRSSKSATFHYDKDFEKSPLPELLTRIKIDLKRLFVTVIDHTTGQVTGECTGAGTGLIFLEDSCLGRHLHPLMIAA